MNEFIWHKEYSLDEVNRLSKGTMFEYLDIQFTEITSNSLTAAMPVTAKILQPLGRVHGGANVVLAEGIMSTGGNLVVEPDKFACVGLEINANHIRPATSGTVIAIARPLHLGRTTHVWECTLKHNDKITCISRMTLAVISR